MNKKLLSLILIIGLISSASAAPGGQKTCADVPASNLLGIDKCAEGAQTTDISTAPAKCLAGWGYTHSATNEYSGSCTACVAGTYFTDADAAVGSKTQSRACTACPSGSTTPDTKNTVVGDCICAQGQALHAGATPSAACVEIPVAQKVTGALEVTTSDGTTTFTVVSCDNTDGYRPTPVAGACTACDARATGCGTCDADKATCTACYKGARDTDNGAPTTCALCTGNCAECTSAATGTPPAEVCSQAQDGYYVDANQAVQQCPPNATKCEWNASATPAAVKVTAVAAGYFIKTGFLSVATVCPEGKSSAANEAADSADGAAVCTIQCASNCLSCVTALAGKCDQCQDDYYIADTAQTDATKYCVKFEEATRPATCQTATANDANSCTSCSGDVQFRERDPTAPTADTKFKCTCMAGYTDISNVAAPATKSPICKKCGTGVKNCDAGQTIVCTNAAEQVAGENCAATTAAVPGFFFDTATTAFKACDATCATCAGGDATKCVTCAQITVDTTQLTEQDVTTLSAAWTNGTYTATAPGTCYAKCPEGYQTDPAVRTACEMGSFGNILSAIVLISFIILMF